MNRNETDKQNLEQAAGFRKPWVKPFVKAMRAGNAENVPGSAFQDGPLETTGS